jgi:hypothetical protein
MKHLLRTVPETMGIAIAIADATLRTLAGLLFAPSEARVYGFLLIGNVHHHNEIRALGWTTMQWFGVGGALVVILYSALRFGEYGARPGNVWFLVARALLASMAGILLLNVAESLLTQKVTNYIGWTHGGRFTAINLGDAVTWLASGLFLPAVVAAFALAFVAQAKSR